MTDNETNERINRLEKELNRSRIRSRWLLGALGLGVLALFIGGAAKNRDEIRAKQFILVDENGKGRAQLSIEKYGPALYVFDENGKERIVLGIGQDAPGLFIYDEKGKNRAAVWANESAAAVNLFDKNGQSRIGLLADENGPELGIRDENGKLRARLENYRERGTQFYLFGKTEKNRIGLEVNDQKDWEGLALIDENDVNRASLANIKIGPGLALSDEKGEPRVGLRIDGNGHGVVFHK